jgi:hypothetical protein
VHKGWEIETPQQKLSAHGSDFMKNIVGGGVNALKGRWRDPSKKLGTHGSVFMDK